MLILYRLPNQGWNPTQFMEDFDELYEFARSLRHCLVVGTTAEWDLLKALELVHGKTLPLEFDPTYSFRVTNTTQLRIMDVNP